jgi:Holliday junction resolvase
MRESRVERTVNEYARGRGWLAFKWVSTSQRGVPDCIYFKDGECLMIEFKAPGNRATPYQNAIHRKLKEHGFHVYVVDNIDQGKLLF